ncbi:hypothetical protein ACROYT_G036022 [Oculina patagonica]
MPQLKRLAQKPRTKSTDNTRVVELRKERSRDAARSRRGKENAQFDELAKLLPLPSAITSQLDKASIVRLTISYLNMKQFGRRRVKRYRQASTCSVLSESSMSPLSDVDVDGSPASPSPPSSISSPPPTASTSAAAAIVPFNQGTASYSDLAANSGIFLLQALDGFLFVLSSDAKVLYVSETVSVHLGLSQVELTGSSMFCYIHPEDQQDLINVLEAAKEELENTSSQSATTGRYTDDIPFFGNQQGFLNEDGRPNKEKPKSFFLRMKCTLVRRGGSYTKSSGFKVIHCMGRMKRYSTGGIPGPKYAFVAIAQPLPTMNINELPLECNMFVSRVNMDLRIVYCEGRIHKFMDYFARDIVGMSAYDFYHGNDVAVIQSHHAKFLTKGQVLTKYYRWMNKNGGWVWMQTKASLIPHPTNPELKQMLCLNYLVSEVEHRGVVLGMAQLEDKPALHPKAYITEVENESDVSSDLKDAQYDDQVMVYPKWHETSDNLVPKPTLLDSLALTRSGYPTTTGADATGLENDVFTTSAEPWGQASTSTWSSAGRLNELSRSDSLIGNGGSSSTIDDDFDDWAKMINAELNELDRDIVKYVATGGDEIVQLPDTSLEVLLNTDNLDLQSNAAIQNLVAPKIEEIPMDSESNPTVSSLTPVNAQSMPPPRMPSAAFGSNMPMDTFAGDTKPSLMPMNQGDLQERGLGFTGSKVRGMNSPCMFGNANSTGERNYQQKAPALSHLNSAASSNAPVQLLQMQPTQNIQPARDPNAMKTTQSRNSGRMPQMPRSDMTSTGGGNFRVPAPVLQMPRQNDLQQQLFQELRGMIPEDMCYTDQMVVDLVDDMMLDADKRKDEDKQLASLLQQGGFVQIEEIPEIEIKQEVVTPTLPQPTSSFPSFSDSLANQSSQPQVLSSSSSSFTSTDPFNQLSGNHSTFGAPPTRRPQNGTVHNQSPPVRFQNGNSQFVNQGDNNMNFLNSLSNAGVTSTQTGAPMPSNNLWNSNPPIKQNVMQQGLRNLLQSTGSPPPKQTTNFQNSQVNSGMMAQQPNMPFLPQQNVTNMVPQNGSINTQSNLFNMTVVPNVDQMNLQELNQVNALLQSVPTLQASSYQNINGTNMNIGNQHYQKFDMNRKL